MRSVRDRRSHWPSRRGRSDGACWDWASRLRRKLLGQGRHGWDGRICDATRREPTRRWVAKGPLRHRAGTAASPESSAAAARCAPRWSGDVSIIGRHALPPLSGTLRLHLGHRDRRRRVRSQGRRGSVLRCALDGVRGLRWNMVPGPTSLATTTTRGHLLRARQWRRVDPEPWSQHDWR